MIVFWLPVAAGILLGTLTGGRAAHLAAVRLRAVWLLGAAAATQLALGFAPPTLPEDGLDPMRVAVPLGTAATCLFLLLNRHVPGARLVLAGALANLAVVCANGGLMPTTGAALLSAGKPESIEAARMHPGVRMERSKDVLLAPDETRLPWLSDVLVSPPLPHRKVMSAGDLVIAAGLAYLTARVMRQAPIPLETPTTLEESNRDAQDTTPPLWIGSALRS